MCFITPAASCGWLFSYRAERCHTLFFTANIGAIVPGKSKAIRAAGSYTISQPDPLLCRGCSGAEGLIVLFSIRGTEGAMPEILGDEENIIAAWGMQDFMGYMK
jgi:hypothetical protein